MKYSNRGLSSATFANGVMQGANFVSGLQDRKQRRKESEHRMGLRDVRANRQQEIDTHTAQETRTKEARLTRAAKAKQDAEYHDLQIGKAQSHVGGNKEDGAQGKEGRAQKVEVEKSFLLSAQLLHGVADPSKITPAQKKMFKKHPLTDVRYLQSDEVGNALTTAKEAIKTGQLNTPEMHRAMEVFDPNVVSGATEGRNVSIARLLPGTKKDHFIVGLRVEGDNKIRPFTVSRSADDNDEIKQFSIDSVAEKIHQIEQARQLSQNPTYIQNELGIKGVPKSKESPPSDTAMPNEDISLQPKPEAIAPQENTPSEFNDQDFLRSLGAIR